MNLDIRNSTQAQLETGALDLASHKLEPLGGDGELALYRAHPAESSKSSPSMLVVVPLTQPSPAALRRMRHEYALRDQLDGASAVRPLALAQLEGRSALVLEDPGGMPLDRLIHGPMELGRFLHFAAGIARALRELHARNLIHKDVKPANVLVDAADEPGPPHGLWHRVAASARAPVARAPRAHRRDAGLHGPRADRADEPLGRFAQRPLRAGRDALRDAHRQPAVQRCRPDGVGALSHRAERRCRPTSAARMCRRPSLPS